MSVVYGGRRAEWAGGSRVLQGSQDCRECNDYGARRGGLQAGDDTRGPADFGSGEADGAAAEDGADSFRVRIGDFLDGSRRFERALGGAEFSHGRRWTVDVPAG